MFDDRLTAVGLETAVLSLATSTDLQRYQVLFTLLVECAMLGKETRSHLARIAAGHKA